MLLQVASFNTFVSRRTHSHSSCDRLCTDQNDPAASVHLCGDIAVVCSKLSQTSQQSNTESEADCVSDKRYASELLVRSLIIYLTSSLIVFAGNIPWSIRLSFPSTK